MPLIKDNSVVADPWQEFDAATALTDAAAVIFRFDDWLTHRTEIEGGRQRLGERLGVRLAGDQDLGAIRDDLPRLDLVALEFPKFTDGRAYSLARLLREHYQFDGEVRAVGHVLKDQFQFMQRCGFDAFEIAEDQSIEAWLQTAAQISHVYQPAADRLAPIFQRRQAAAHSTI